MLSKIDVEHCSKCENTQTYVEKKNSQQLEQKGDRTRRLHFINIALYVIMNE